MDERDDYEDVETGPGWEPAPGTLIVLGFANSVLVACGTLAILFGFLVGTFR